MMQINFYNDSSFKYLRKSRIMSAIENVMAGEKIDDYDINIIITSDDNIHKINKDYLAHDFPTDVITFKLEEKPLEGEIYVSADTALAQSAEYKVSHTTELMRLAAHGALHLAGYDDNTDELRLAMHKLENKYITE